MNNEKLEYTKKVIDINWFIGRIESKWFSISDVNITKNFLDKKWYYHTSTYIKCFCETVDWEDKTIIDKIDFINVITLFNLDKKLQEKLLNAVLEIETFIKADFIQRLSINYKSPFWYLDRNNVAYRAEENFKKSILKIQDDNKKSPAFKHFFEKYKWDFLPIRHIVEFSSFGSFTKLFDFLKDDDLFLFCSKYNAVSITNTGIMYDKEQLKQRLKWLSSLRNRLAHSEISRSPKALPQIILPWFYLQLKLNTLSSYIQLIYHFLKMIDEEYAETFYTDCYYLLLEISKIKWIHIREFNKIGLKEWWEKRFKK